MWGFGKFAFLSFVLSGALIFWSTAVSDDEWSHKAGTLLLDLSALLVWDALTLKGLDYQKGLVLRGAYFFPSLFFLAV